MALPDFQTVMLPLLRYAEDGRRTRVREAVAHLAEGFNLTEEERRKKLPSGTAKAFDNTVGWALTHLRNAVLIASPERGWIEITERGRKVLAGNPARVDMKLLEQFEEYIAFRQRRHNKPKQAEGDVAAGTVAVSVDYANTPLEQLESAYQSLRSALADDLRRAVQNASPEFFEQLVLDLLVKMGYGGSRREAAMGTRSSGDEGIDGVINEDRLGLDTIYIQAKRWKDGNTVGRPDVQKFAGALQGQQASKGVFITASSFTREARDFASRIAAKVILIDGDELADLMFEHGVGVTTVDVYKVKRLDTDYFLED